MESIHFRNGTKKDIGVLAELFRETVCRIRQPGLIHRNRLQPGREAQRRSGGTGSSPERSGLFLPNGIRMERYSVLQQSIGDIVHSLFVHAEYQSRGIGSGLLEQAEAYAHMQGAVRITSEVSLTARPFFERKGYRVDREQQIDRGGVLLTNFLMYKTLS